MDLGKLSQGNAAKLFGVSRSAIQKRTAAGMPRNDDGTYCAPDCIEWLVAKYRDAAPKTSGEDADELAVQELRWKTARADKTTLEAAEMCGRLCDVEKVEQQWIMALTSLSTIPQSIPGTMAVRLLGCDEAEIEAELVLALKGAMKQAKAVYAAALDKEAGAAEPAV